MSASLPERANAEFLRKQAKDLCQAFGHGDVEAVSQVHQYLPRAGKLDAHGLRMLVLALQEAQHVLACHYGFRKWTELLAVVETPDLEELCRLSDRDAQVLLRTCNALDVAYVLSLASESLRQRLLTVVSKRISAYLQSEIDFIDDSVGERTTAAKKRFFGQFAHLRQTGQLTWPPPEDAPPSPARPTSEGPGLRLAHKLPTDLTIDELAELLHDLVALARGEGILALEGLLSEGRTTLLKEGIALIVDGTEPDLVQDLLETRAVTILRNRTVRGHMAIEGWMSIESGDNPAIVRHKLETYYVDESDLEWIPRHDPTVDDLVARLRSTPATRQSYADMADFYRSMAFVARHRGLIELEPLLEAVDDPVLATGLRESTHQKAERRQTQRVLAEMQACLQRLRLELHARNTFVIEGIFGIQAGGEPAVVVAAARASAHAQVEKLEAKGLPPAAQA